jgi:coproporphyrinogen III oxidase-like Fe-S oxidoreductase
MSKIEMMASSGNVDDLQAICRDALNVLNKVAPTHYAKFIKQLTTGKNPSSLAPASVDKTGVARGSTGRANIGVQDLSPEVQQRLAQQQK